MAEPLTELDKFLLNQWTDASALREALTDLEQRLSDRLRGVADRLPPWLESRGFILQDIEAKYACINVGKKAWMSADGEARIYISVAALYPFGFRRNEEDHPYVWVYTYGLSKAEQKAFRDAAVKRIGEKPGYWINDDCSQKAPVGRYIRSHGDAERVQLALSEDALEAFVKEQLEPLLEISADLDAALAET